MATKSSAKKSVSGKKAGAKKSSARNSARAANAAPAKRSATARKTGGGRRDPPPPSIWIAGTLAVSGGQIGMQTSSGFVSLQQVADTGQVMGLVFQPSAGAKPGAVKDMLDKLRAFIEAYGVGAVSGGVTTCFGP